MADIQDLSGDDASIAELFEEIMSELRLLSTLYMKTHPPDVAISDAFDTAEVIAAIRGSQRGEVQYPEFVRRTMGAGCIGCVLAHPATR